MDVDASEQSNSTSLLDFLNIHLAQQQSNDTNEHNGHAQPDASDQENNDTYEENTQQLSVGEVLERELAALLTQSTNNINTSASSDLETTGPSTLPTNTTSSINTSGDASVAQETLVEQPHEHEHYLSGLAAVLQAAQAMQARNVVKNVPAFHSLNAESDSTQVDERGDTRAEVSETAGEGQMGDGLSNEFSDLLAHLTAQLEQASEQNAPVEDPIPSSMASGSTEDTSERYNFFAPTPSSIIQAGSSHTPTVHSVPALSSGTIPYYSGVFGTSGSKSSAAGPSAQKDQDPTTDGNETTKRKRRRKAVEKKTFPCEYGCDKTFGRKSDALRHARIHTGDRPFSCPYTECGKAFIQRSALHVHLRVHSGDKPHMCEYPLCGRTFSDSSSLARHRRTHTGRRPYACERPDCAKTFTRRTTLTAHMRTHDPTWEPDPRKRYSFKPKRRKTDGEEEEEDEEEEGGEEDAATLETLSSLLAQAGPGGTLPPLGVNLELNGSGGRTGSMNTNAPLEARVAAISAEIAAAIAQAQIQAQLDDDDDEDEEGESDEEEQDEQDNGNMRGIAHGMNVSGIRTEQPEPRPEDVVPPSPVTASVAAPAPPLAEHHVSSTVVGDEEEDDFPVPLRERKSKPIDVVSAGVNERDEMHGVGLIGLVEDAAGRRNSVIRFT